MKYIARKYRYLTMKFGAVAVILFSSCDSGFEEMNANPLSFNEPVIENLFSYSLVKTAGANDGNTLYPNDKLAGAFMQYFASLNPYQWTGDKYLYKNEYNKGLFETAYSTELKEIEQILFLVKDQPDLINQYAIARIWRVYILHRVTDMYGDIPYFEAGKGYLDDIYKPKYDRQSEIYADMLKELEEAALQLDPSKTSFGSADFLYNGNVDQWQSFAYSLMLRLGMRLTEVDLGMAETWVKKAIAGGVMQSNEDIAKLEHTDDTSNNFYWDGRELRGAEGVPPSAMGLGYGKMSNTFVDYLKDTQDPRLPFYITLWPGNADPSLLTTSTEPSQQRGLPNGYDVTSIKEVIPDWSDEILSQISEINLNTIASNSTPTIFQSFTEVEFLLAEAALRGWDTGDAKTYYERGLKASMDIEVIYPGGMSVTAAEFDEYLAANPYEIGSFDIQMEQIHTQFWLSLFMNNIEVYANWRRTGYPTLTPTNYPGNETGGVIPRRLRYPESEASLNTENYKAAVQEQGPDLFTTRIWWDKE